MDYVYDGLVTLPADPAGYAFAPTAPPPTIPPGLAGQAPPGASWRTSADFDAAMGGAFWLDTGSHTLYFHLLRG
jgi:hypothetical protein